MLDNVILDSGVGICDQFWNIRTSQFRLENTTECSHALTGLQVAEHLIHFCPFQILFIA